MACSSAVEQATVNRPVVGSIPTMPANLLGDCDGRCENSLVVVYAECGGLVIACYVQV